MWEWLGGCVGPRGPPAPEVPETPPELLYLEKARKRENVLVSVHLQSTDDEQQGVWIGTYHMPCAFMDPQLMVMHAALAAQQMQRLAIKSQTPCILAGGLLHDVRVYMCGLHACRAILISLLTCEPRTNYPPTYK